MRRGLAWAAVVVGAVGVLVGLVVAVVVGPDDTVARAPHRLPAQGSQPSTALMAYSAWPRLFSYRDLTLVVTARGGGSVFVGTANPIDADSYADGVRSYRFSEISSGGRITGGRASDGTRAQPVVAPSKATFWTAEAAGSGEARLAVPMDGTPVSVVALSERGPLALGFGAKFTGLFRTALTVLLVGLLLAGYGGWRLRRLRRMRHGPTDEPIATRTAGVTAGGLALLLLASGCGWIPETVEPRTPIKVPLDRSELQGVLDDYERRNNAAIKASDTRFDGSLWAQADGGSVLAGDQFDTDYGRALGKKGEGVLLEHTGERLFAPSKGSYPLSVIVTSDLAERGSTAKERAAQKYVATYLMTRACSTCSWLVTVSAAMPRDRQPTPRAPGSSSVATAAQQSSASVVQDDLAQYMRTGKARLVTPAGGLAQFRSRFTDADSFERVDLQASAYDDGASTSSGSGAARWR